MFSEGFCVDDLYSPLEGRRPVLQEGGEDHPVVGLQVAGRYQLLHLKKNNDKK